MRTPRAISIDVWLALIGCKSRLGPCPPASLREPLACRGSSGIRAPTGKGDTVPASSTRKRATVRAVDNARAARFENSARRASNRISFASGQPSARLPAALSDPRPPDIPTLQHPAGAHHVPVSPPSTNEEPNQIPYAHPNPIRYQSLAGPLPPAPARSPRRLCFPPHR